MHVDLKFRHRYVYVCVCVCVCGCRVVCVDGCVCVWAYGRVCMCVCMRIYVCVYLCMWVCEGLHCTEGAVVFLYMQGEINMYLLKALPCLSDFLLTRILRHGPQVKEQ